MFGTFENFDPWGLVLCQGMIYINKNIKIIYVLEKPAEPTHPLNPLFHLYPDSAAQLEFVGEHRLR